MKPINNCRRATREALLATCLATLYGFAALLSSRSFAGPPADAEPPKQNLPPYKMTNRDIYYPDSAKRDGIEGKVLVAFDIVSGGRIGNLAILDSDNSAFEATARNIMSGLRFELPGGWASSPAHLLRYHMGFVFCIPPSGMNQSFGISVSPIVISTNRLPGSPVRNPVAPGTTGQCGT